MTAVSRQDSLLEQMKLTGRVITGLVLREVKTRFGRQKFGVIWILIEPIVYVAIFVALRSQLRSIAGFGEDIVLFMITGLLTYRLFSSVANRSVHAISANKALLTYPPVKPIDAIAARLLLEILTMYVVSVLFYVFLAFSTGTFVIVNHDRFVAAYFAVTLLGVGVGTLNATLSVIWPTWERIWALSRLPLLLISGIFYVPQSLPLAAQEVLQWNPILNCVEWVRTAIYLSYDPMLNQTYVIMFGLVTLTMGLALERAYRYRLLST